MSCVYVYRVRSVNTTSTDYTVEGLLPNTEYRFTVWSYNRNGRSLRSTEIIATTEAEVAVPEPVTNMRAWATDEESIKVTWEEPAVTNGPITAYKYVLNYTHTNSALWLTLKLLYSSQSNMVNPQVY